jgi:hypothetical protein
MTNQENGEQEVIIDGIIQELDIKRKIIYKKIMFKLLA